MRQSGFTLLELMVVVVLIGIILTFVVGSVGDGGKHDRIQRETKRLNALIEMVGEEAILQSAIIGLHVEEQTYQFLRYQEDEWQVVENDSLLKKRALDSSMVLQLLVEGFAIELGGETEAEGEEKSAIKPQVVFLPSGERTSFELALTYEDDRSGYLLRAPVMGTVEERRLEAQY